MQFDSPEKFAHGAFVKPSGSVVTGTTRPARSGTLAMPVSINATVTPLPLYPLFHILSALTALGYTDRTFEESGAPSM